MRWGLTLLFSMGLGCTGPNDTDGTETGEIGSGDTGDTEPCGTAGQVLSDSSIELAHDDGSQVYQIEETGWVFYDIPLGDTPLFEAVAFELEHPARIHGFRVNWALYPDDPDAELVAGVYPDFGYNGFDFWQYEPLWEGSRCAGDVSDGEWLTYSLETPIEIEEPGLVYVAHRRQGAGDRAWGLDGSYRDDGDCGSWGECRSAVNLPEADIDLQFNGLSSPIPYDYMVRLWVEYTDDVESSETLFQPISDVSPGNRMAWADYDGDGWDDLFTAGPILYRNDGAGGFEDMTVSSGLSVSPGSGGTWGDYDNDGCPDLLAFAESYTSGEVLWRNNCDGTFTDVTVVAGISDVQDYNDCDGGEDNIHAPTTAVGWWDIDADGYLDLYLANMICWSTWTFYHDEIYRNNGDGTFSEWTGENGFDTLRYSGRGAGPIDYDQDGDVDLLVNNYTLHKNRFWENNGDGTVTERAASLGLTGNLDWVGTAYYGHTIGAVWGDLDNDGDFDSVQANLAHPRFFQFSDKTQILLQNEEGEFEDIQGDWEYPRGEAGLRFQETHSVPVLADFDQDGVLDLAISATYDGRPSDFYWGLGDGTFELDNYHAGITIRNGWCMAVSDMDQDGDVDLAASGTVLENTGSGFEAGNWLQILPIGNVDSNWSALGASVRVHSGESMWLRHVSGGNGQGCQDSSNLHIGLGTVDRIDSISVDFPGGGTVEYTGPFDSNRRLVVYEDGTVTVR